MKKTAAGFGAGNLGRSFVAQSLRARGCQLVFADVNRALIGAPQTQPNYQGREAGEGAQAANIVTTALGPRTSRYLTPAITKGLDACDEQLRLDR